MPTRQVLFGIALLGAAGAVWADDSMFPAAVGRSAPAGAGSGAAVPPTGKPVVLAVRSGSPGALPVPAGFARASRPGVPVEGGAPMAGSGEPGTSRLISESGLTGLSVQPTFSYQISDALSVGVGPRFVHGAVVGGAVPGSDPADAPAAYHDSDTSAGLNLGLLYRLGDSTWLGLAYASGYELELDERAGIADPVANIVQGRPETNRLIAETRAPDSVTASISHRLDNGWMLSASLGWMGWSGLERAVGEAPALGAAGAGSEHQYRDTWRLALGAEQQLGERLRWSMGVSYDSSPLPGNQRNLDDPLPENLRLAAGLSYQMDEGVELQLGYSLVWLGESDSRQNNRTRNDSLLSAEPPSSTLHVIGGGMVWRF
ncbi:OmpP1/FadL family transporter [Azotobacter salinestris]|uniref:OmpP1/FadL family transporter n=1 Tax=Azotobacter salinestris TaxID=69964 RepID=UPI0032E03E04